MAIPNLDSLRAALGDQYRIERELGAGGMATVFLAEDLKHGRLVAVKVLDPDIAAGVGAERFLREVRITAGLQHPNILTLIDSGESGGFLYYVMPFADGESLRTRLTRAGGPLPHDEALRIMREIADALGHAHRHGVVHRDVKPENVMLAEGHALVLDFGVAKAVQVARERPTADDATASPVGTRHGLTSVGTSLGTPAYMSPEQAAGDPDVDHRADIYSLGLVAYEMLGGRAPFQGRPSEVMARQVSEAPRPLGELAPTLPAPIVRLVMRCLEKSPEARPQTGNDLLVALQAATGSGGGSTGPAGLFRAVEARVGRRGALALAFATLAIVAVAGWSAVAGRRDARWIRETAVPGIRRLLDASQNDSAFMLAERARALAPGDSAVQSLAREATRELLFVTEPSAARISWTPYEDSTAWRMAGTSPATIRLPATFVRVRVEREGYRTVERAVNPGGPLRLVGRDSILHLDAADAPFPEMVLVDGGEVTVDMPGLSNLAPATLAPFRIDRYEITNAEFKRFVDAGGYQRQEFWTQPIRADGRILTLEEARARFVDRTGRPGPAGWEAGDLPAGTADLPVGGVSWYEAMAYAAFVGKALPSVYHWERAAEVADAAHVVPGSNFASKGPRAGSRFGGMSRSGAYDMAGNVREWIYNHFGEQRLILGGGWIDDAYHFVDAYAQDPMDRSAINGIRLMERLPEDAATAAARTRVVREFRDYTKERPVGDDVYRGLIAMYAYDRTPLDARVESVDSTRAEWVTEKVSIATAYGRQRLPIYLYVPRRRAVPTQAVVVFPGSNAFYENAVSPPDLQRLDAILKSGRIVVYPVYASQFEREHVLVTDAPNESAAYRDHVVMWVKDFRRTVDYLETRSDVDAARLAYAGLSFGGRVAPILLALEPRIRTAVLYVAGLKMERTRPESDPLNYLPRVRIPVLMLNGRYDHYFPLETSQRPYFGFLGTPAADKRLVVNETGHSVPRTVTIGETLAWLDRYLGVPTPPQAGTVRP